MGKSSKINYEIRFNKAKKEINYKSKEIESIIVELFDNIGVEIRHSINNKGDFIWIKFTIDGYVGDVASGCDFNFSVNNTSGRLVHDYDKSWDEKKILVFPKKIS